MTFECSQFENDIYFHIRNDFEDWYVKFFDQEYKNGVALVPNLPQDMIDKYNINDGVQKVAKEYRYYTNFSKICN